MQDSFKEEDPDKTGISLIRVNNEKELQLHHVDAIARSLTGQDVPRLFPLYLAYYHGKLCGYIQTVQQLVIYPALHPELMSPRVFLKLTRSLITEMKRMTGNPLFMLCSKSVAFGQKNMKRIRLKKAPEEAYIYDEEAK